MELDVSAWSGEGDFTQLVVERLRTEPRIALLRVEDAPATREDAGYLFLSNELFVQPRLETRLEPVRRFGLFPGSRRVDVPALGLAEIEAVLASDASIGAPDFSDHGLIQYLRTQRIVPPYQSRGYKLVELIRIYLARPEASS
ncbi:MAG: hypothetical protein ABL982_03005 [Vicinamibacterales bacterium]